MVAALASLKPASGKVPAAPPAPAAPKKKEARGVDVTPLSQATKAPPKQTKNLSAKVAAAAMLSTVVAIGIVVALRPPEVVNLPVPTLPAGAATCRALTSEGDTLICTATSTSLNGLLPRERDERLHKTSGAAKAAGFARIVFQDNGRPWRTVDLSQVKATTTTATATTTAPAATTAPATTTTAPATTTTAPATTTTAPATTTTAPATTTTAPATTTTPATTAPAAPTSADKRQDGVLVPKVAPKPLDVGALNY